MRPWQVSAAVVAFGAGAALGLLLLVATGGAWFADRPAGWDGIAWEVDRVIAPVALAVSIVLGVLALGLWRGARAAHAATLVLCALGLVASLTTAPRMAPLVAPLAIVMPLAVAALLLPRPVRSWFARA